MIILVLRRGYMWNKIISKLFQPSSTSVWNNFADNYFEIISEAYRSSWILFSNMFNVADIFEIISAVEIILT